MTSSRFSSKGMMSFRRPQLGAACRLTRTVCGRAVLVKKQKGHILDPAKRVEM
jgi:hypothetical protein